MTSGWSGAATSRRSRSPWSSRTRAIKSERRWLSYRPREGTDERLHHNFRLDFLSGDRARDRLIPTHSVAVYFHDFALLFLRILEHVGYQGEVAAIAALSEVKERGLGIRSGAYFPTMHPISVDRVEGRPLVGLVQELPDAVGRWVKKTMDRLFLAGGIRTGAYFIDSDGRLLDRD